MLLLHSPHSLCFRVAQHDMLPFICHFHIWGSGENGAIQPSQLNTLLLTDRGLKCNRSHEAVVEVLTFKSQLHAETWHVVSTYNFQFHGTFLLVLPVDFVLPSSSLSVNTAGIISWGSLLSYLILRALCDSWGVSVGRDLSLHSSMHIYTHIQMPHNSITRNLPEANLLQSQCLKGI